MRRQVVGTVGLLLSGVLCVPMPSVADDKWEFGSLFNDDTVSTKNVLDYGVVQTHDLQGTALVPDQDWMDIPEILGHSFEVRVSGASFQWNVVGFGCQNCADLHRVDFNGTVVTNATGGGSNGQALLRWIDTGGGTNNKVRVTGSNGVDFTTNEEYDIQFLDTTYTIARWNNSASQITILIIRNNTSSTVTGDIYFYNAVGTLLHTEPLSVPARGTQVVNSSVLPGLAGASGSVAIAHLGGYGALAGKGVALEPGTGFTFDTMMVPVGR